MASRKITRQQISLIHVAKSRLKLSEDDYRALLSGFGVASSKDLTRAQFREVMTAFNKLGFEQRQQQEKSSLPNWSQPRAAREHPVPVKQQKTGSPHAWLTEKQRAKIVLLWDEISRVDDPKKFMALNTLCHKITRIHHIDWLSVGAAQKLIVALERMKENKRKQEADGTSKENA